MRKTEVILQFIEDNYINNDSVDSLLDEIDITRKQLITRLFKIANKTLGEFENSEYESNLVLNICNFIFMLCEEEDFNEEQVMIFRNRIKKTREAMLAIGNKFKNDTLFKAANILDEIILDKKLDVEPIITMSLSSANFFAFSHSSLFSYDLITKSYSLSKSLNPKSNLH